MYILHVYLHVKEYVADITFSIILEVKVPTFRSLLLRKGSQIVLKIIRNAYFFRISDAITFFEQFNMDTCLMTNAWNKLPPAKDVV